MKYAIVANPERDECIKAAEMLSSKIDAVLEEKIANKMGRDGIPLEKIDVDVIITLGGDGTILITLQKAKGKILGVNMGVLGFLTEIEIGKIFEALKKIESGEYILDKRMKMAVYLNKKRLYDCINEAVIHTSDIAKLRNYQILFNDEIVDEIRADGVIVSTPTGSTSYALSAGGPILHPTIEGFVVVPIAPFKFTMHSVVLPAGTVKVQTLGHRDNLLVLDGQQYFTTKPGDTVEIKKSENYAEFIRFEKSFFERIRHRARGR